MVWRQAAVRGAAYLLAPRAGASGAAPAAVAFRGAWHGPALAARRAAARRGVRELCQRQFHATRAPLLAAKRDYYEVLGVPRGADKKEVKKKYFEQAKKLHPDANKDDPKAAEKFQEVKEAYEVLSDERKRQAYDMYGHAGVDAASQGGADFGGGQGFESPFGQGGFHFHGSGGAADLEDVLRTFEDLIHGRGGPRGRRAGRGRDLQMAMEVSFLEAVHGVTKPLNLEYETFDGSGGVRTEARTVDVDLPAGIYDGVTIRIQGAGDKGRNGGPDGDLYVSVGVKKDSYFKREDTDIHTDLPLTLSQAILGATVDVLTLEGMVELRVPPGTQHGVRLLIRGRGVPQLGRKSIRGNHYVNIKVAVPKPSDLTERQRELVEELRAEEQRKEEAESEGGQAKGWAGTVGSALDRLRSYLGKGSGKRKASG